MKFKIKTDNIKLVTQDYKLASTVINFIAAEEKRLQELMTRAPEVPKDEVVRVMASTDFNSNPFYQEFIGNTKSFKKKNKKNKVVSKKEVLPRHQSDKHNGWIQWTDQEDDFLISNLEKGTSFLVESKKLNSRHSKPAIMTRYYALRTRDTNHASAKACVKAAQKLS